MMTLSLDTTDQASVIVRDDDKSPIRLTNAQINFNGSPDMSHTFEFF